ncbi:MAG TPA: hypothetical protein PLB25_06410 [Rhodoferax sp.]|nr:hypothetical protein [Rhodoferax sp.]
MKNISHIELLNQIEAKVEAFANALQSNRLEELVSVAVSFQMACVELSSCMQKVPTDDVGTRRKIGQVAALMAAQRVALMRRSMLVERGLATLMPAVHAETYVPSAGRFSSNLYASAGRRSGEFRTSVA